jgi:hypothetical protein
MTVKRVASFGLRLVVVLMLVRVSPGKFVRVEVQSVPIERLITNLEEALKKDPKNVQTLVNLARVHGMAYAFKTDTAPVALGREDRGPWFGFAPKLVPFSQVEKTGDLAKEKAAKVHLTKAVNRFREAVRLG